MKDTSGGLYFTPSRRLPAAKRGRGERAYEDATLYKSH